MAIHVRLEIDRATTSDEFEKALALYVTNIKNSKCLAGFPKHPNGSFVSHHVPDFYMASGLFDTTELELGRRKNVLLTAVGNLGITKIYTREILRERHLRHGEHTESIP